MEAEKTFLKRVFWTEKSRHFLEKLLASRTFEFHLRVFLSIVFYKHYFATLITLTGF